MGGQTRDPIPGWDSRRTTAAARSLIQVGMEHGLGLAECLHGTRITPDELQDPSAEIGPDQELRLARNLLDHLGDRPGLGVEAGLRYTLANTGILGFALLSSPTVRDAAAVGLRYAALSSAFLRFSLQETGDQARLVCDDEEIPADARAFLVERDLVALGVIAPVLLGPVLFDRVHQARLELRMDPERGRALAEAIPLTNIEFRRPRNVLVFPRAILDEPLPQADEHTARMCERQCQELLQRRHRRRGFAEQVRSRLLRDPGELPAMEVVARELHIDPRTLRRHLTCEGTSFRALVDEVRETLAIELLGQVGLSVQEVAQRLGYAEVSGFTHAFTRWHGVPPSEYRRTLPRPPRAQPPEST